MYNIAFHSHNYQILNTKPGKSQYLLVEFPNFDRKTNTVYKTAYLTPKQYRIVCMENLLT